VTQPFYAGSAITAAALNSLATTVAVAAGGQTISSTSPVPITGLSVAVGPDTYLVRCWIVLNATVGGSNAEFRFTGPTASAYYITISSTAMLTGGAPPVIGYTASTGYNGGFLNTSPLAGGDFYLVEIEMLVTFSAAGTLALQAAEQTSGDDYEVVVGSHMDVLQVLS
jgi:hypothetical protein